ncbi:MAG: 6-phosphogluconolactonase [Candidatus Saccharimonadales bacterium]
MTYTKAQAIQKIADKLSELSYEKTLLLLSGGSSAEVGARAYLLAQPKYTTVAMVDERFVEFGSEDSNATLLKKAGLTTFSEIIHKDSIGRHETAVQYENTLNDLVQNNGKVIAVVGIGTDNHTAGILPNTSAATTHHDGVTDYETEQFERITITPAFFEHIDIVYVYAEGESKAEAISLLEERRDSVKEPSQNIKRAKEWHVLFNKENV